jgi:hypothetical protein
MVEAAKSTGTDSSNAKRVTIVAVMALLSWSDCFVNPKI